MPQSHASPNEIYAQTRDNFIAQVRNMDKSQTETVVPACPDWTVRDVLAHVSGLVAESLAAVEGSLGSDEATARQVSDRAHMSAAEICDEWSDNAVAFDAFVVADPAWGVTLISDLVVHVHDVQEALQLPIDRSSAATMIAAERYLARLQQRAADMAAIGVTVHLSDGADWPAPNPDAELHLELTTTAFDFLRHVTGRRSRDQVAALTWSTDPAALLDKAWVQYGTLR